MKIVLTKCCQGSDIISHPCIHFCAFFHFLISNCLSRQILDEVEIRELLIDHVGHRCCWGSRPAQTWKIHAVEDCNVYVGTLDTFTEERETITKWEPNLGAGIDEKDKGPELGIWELDLRSEFPPLFTQNKESRATIPHSEAIVKCSGNGFRNMNSLGLRKLSFWIHSH